jgi:hypothetical protein
MYRIIYKQIIFNIILIYEAMLINSSGTVMLLLPKHA